MFFPECVRIVENQFIFSIHIPENHAVAAVMIIEQLFFNFPVPVQFIVVQMSDRLDIACLRVR